MPLASDQRPRSGSGHGLHSPSGDPGRSVHGDRCRWSRRQGKPAADSAVRPLSAAADAPRSVLERIVYRASAGLRRGPDWLGGTAVRGWPGSRGLSAPDSVGLQTGGGGRGLSKGWTRVWHSHDVSTGEAFARGLTEGESSEAQDRDPDVPPKPDGVADRVGDTRLTRPDGRCGGPASLAYGQLHGSTQLWDAIRE